PGAEREPRRRSVGDQRVQVELGEPVAAAEEAELDDEAGADDVAPELLHEPADRLDRAPGREHVVVDHDPGAGPDQVRVQLERVLAVLEHVARAHGLGRELAGPPRRDEAAAGRGGDRRAEDEAARLGPEDEVGLALPHPAGEVGDRLAEGLGVGEQRRDVLEPDPGGREVRHLPDLRPQVGHGLGARDVPHAAPEEEGGELLRQLGERLEVAQPRRAPLGVPRAERRRHELVEQRRLAVGGRAEGAQVAGVGAVARELRADGGDVDVGLGVALVRARAARAEEAERLQVLREARRHAGAAAELVEVELVHPVGEAGRTPPLALGRPGGRELVADHAQRQELVALEAEDRRQPLEVLLAEEPVAAARALRREQALVLEEADLRDRDVRELVREAPDDLPDPEQARAAAEGRGHRSTKVSRYLPIWSSSPFSSSWLSIRRRLTKVPFSEPWSSITNLPSRSTSTAWLRDTVTSSRKISHSGDRPMRVRSPRGRKLSPARPPPERTTSAGPSRPSTGSPASSPTSSGESVCVASEPPSPFSSSAPQREQ